MRKNIIFRFIQAFDRIHLGETEIPTLESSFFINSLFKLVIAWIIGLIIIVCYVFVVQPFDEEQSTALPQNQEQSAVEEEQGWLRNEHENVNSYVENYMKALVDCNFNVLNTMVMDPSQFDYERLQKRSEFITNYSNIVCYTKPGLTEGSYVVFALMNVQIEGVTVQPLSLHQFYLVPNEYGGFLQDNTASSEPGIRQLMEQMRQEKEIVELTERVNKNNEESEQQDASYAEFIKMLNGE